MAALSTVEILGIVGVAAAVTALVFLVLFATRARRRLAVRRRGPSSLPDDLLDEHRIGRSGGLVAMRIERIDGQRFEVVIDPRHAHQLSDDLLVVSASLAAARSSDGSGVEDLDK